MNSGNRTIALIVSLVVLTGVLAGGAALWHTQEMRSSYDQVLTAELESKALAYGLTSSALLDELGPDALGALQAVFERSSGELLAESTTTAPSRFTDTYQGYELWLPDPSAPTGFRLLTRQESAEAEALVQDSETRLGLLEDTNALGDGTAAIDREAQLILTSVPVAIDDESQLVAVAVFSANEEFAFFASQKQAAIRNAIVLSGGVVLLVSLAGAALSLLVSRQRSRAEAALCDREAKYRHIFENVQDIYFHTEPTGTIFELSPAVERFGYTREQLIGTSVLDIYEDPDERTAFVQALLEHGEIVDYELHLKAADGRVVPTSTNAFIRRSSDGTAVGIEGTLRDISERKRAEDALRESESKFRTMAETLAAAAFIWQEEKLRYVNPAAEAMTGYSRQELLGMSFWAVIHPEFREIVRQRGVARQRGERVPGRYEIMILTKGGESRWVEFTGSTIDFEGRPAGIGTSFDITERSQAEQALRESEERHRTLLENYIDGVALIVDGRFAYINPRLAEMIGYAPEEMHDRSPMDLTAPDERERAAKQVNAVLAGDNRLVAEHMAVRKDGRLLPVEVSARPIQLAGKTAILAVVRDITERKQAEDALRDSEAKYRHIFENVQDIYFHTEPTGAILELSPAVERFGYTREQLIGTSVLDIYEDPDERTAFVDELLKNGEVLDYELHLRAGDGRVVPSSTSAFIRRGPDGTVVGIEGTLRDITDRKQAEEALRQSESKFRTMAETLAAAAFIFQGYGIRYANAAAETITGYSREELLEVNFWEIIHPESQELVRRQRDGRRAGEQAPMRYEVKILTKGGEEKWVDFTGGPIEFEGRPAVLGTAFDITERKQAEVALREQTRRDPLTGTLNHVAIVDELRRVVIDSGNTVEHGVAMVDVDGLKAVNDTYGHQVGDAVLVAIAGALSRDGAIVGRYGGDEFVVVLPKADRHAAERYRTEVMAAPHAARITDPQSGASVSAAISIGLAVYPDEADTVADLIQLSDSAMYSSKRQRPFLPDGLSTARPQDADRAAEMVGHIVPFLTSPAQLDDRIRMVAQRISVAAGYDAVNIDIFSQRTGPPNARNVFAEVPQEVIEAWRGEQRSVQDDPFIQLVSRTRRGITVDDPQNDQRLTETQRNALRAAELRSAAVVPLYWQDDLIGVLSVASKREGAITARDVQFLTTVATQVSAIVRMATLVEQLQSTSNRLAQAQGDTVLLLAAAAEAHDRGTGLHLQGVRDVSDALAHELGYTDDAASALGLAAVLHDIGKIRVPDSVLANPGPLSDHDWDTMKRHTVWGAEFLAGRPGFELASTIALCHHERWDGTGYPQGLADDAIPEAATIVTVADSFDAMTHDRPYRARRAIDQAVQEIVACSGKQFSPKVVSALRNLYQRGALVPPLTSAPDQEAAA